MKQYFYIDSNNQQIGPVSKEQLIEMRNRGVISDQTNVWADGFPSWIPLIAILQNNETFISHIDETSRKECSQAELVEKKPRRRKLKKGNVAAVLYQSITNRKAQMYRNLAIGGVSLVVGFIACYVFHANNSVEGELPSIPEIPSFAELTAQGKDKTTKKHTGKTTGQIKNKKQPEARSSHESEEAREELQRMGIPIVDYEKRLCEAAQRGNIELVRLLLAAGTHVNTTELDPKGRISTPLSAAVGAGHVECVEILLDAPNIDVNLGNPLRMAIRNKRYNLIQRLLKVDGIDVNQKGGGVNSTPLMDAVFTRDDRATFLILKCNDVDVNATDDMGDAPIHWAVKNKDFSCLELLLKHPDINVNKLDGDRHSPMYHAKMSGNYRLVERLKEAGAI